jgi:TRAP-type mannitol/chloroaromatic compound transport system permease small subunit
MSDAPARGLSSAARRLGAMDERLFHIEKCLNLVAGIVILAMMMLGVLQILSRKLFNFPIPAYIDVIEIVMVLFAFPSLAFAQRLGDHIRMEIVLGRLKGRVYYAVELFGVLAALAIVAVITWFSFDHFLRAWKLGDSTMDGGFPLWPAKLVVPLAFALLFVRLALQVAAFCRMLASAAATPVAIPRLDDPEEAARKHVESEGARSALGAISEDAGAKGAS